MKKDWIEVELSKVCHKVSKVNRKEVYETESFQYIDIGGIDNKSNKILSTKTYSWSDAPSRAQQIVQKDDILFSTVRTYLRNIAKVEDKNLSGQICSSGFTVIRSNEVVIHPSFLFLYVIYEGFLQPLNELQTGSSYPAVRDKDVFSQIIPLPPLPEQRAIVARIEELFSELDHAVSSLQTAQAKLEIYRQAVLKKAFEGGYSKSNPQDHLVRLEEVSDAIGGFAFKSGDFKKDRSTYQVIRIGNIRPGVIRLNESPIFIGKLDSKTLSKAQLLKGDVLITLTGTRKKRDYGFTAIVEVDNLLLNQRVAALRFGEKYYPKFFLYFSWTDFFKDQFFGSETGNVGQGNVGMKSIRETLVPSCEIDLQYQIVQEIESRLSVADRLAETIQISLQKAEALRQSILKKAFKGRLLSEAEVEACRKEADWEPAEKLLERIKLEKSKPKRS